jgi:hypothetical protein
MKCIRCGREAAFTSKGGERVCDQHYRAVFAVAPTILSTGTTADVLGAVGVGAAAAFSPGSGERLPVPGGWLARLWRRLRTQ